MTSILLVSHEKKIVLGAYELIKQMSPGVDLLVSGGTADGEIGTDAMDILEQINKAKFDDVALFFDIGSSYIASQMALEFYEGDKEIHFMNYPLIEGGFVASVCAANGMDIASIEVELKDYKINKIH